MSEFADTIRERLARAEERFREAEQEHRVSTLALRRAQVDLETWQRVGRSEGVLMIEKNPAEEPDEKTKIELIREKIRNAPNGLTPAKIWEGVQKQVVSRKYLYSMLARLLESGDAVTRSGRYYPAKTEEDFDRRTGR